MPIVRAKFCKVEIVSLTLSPILSRLDFRRLSGPVFDPPQRETPFGEEREALSGMTSALFSRPAAGNRA